MKNIQKFSKVGLIIALACGALGCERGLLGARYGSAQVKTSENNPNIAETTLAPDFDLPQVKGGNISLGDLRGDVSVLVFWTAWCPSCKEEAPKINRLAEEFSAKGVRVVGINIGESDQRIAEGINDFAIRYAVVKDRDTAVSKRFKVVGTPTVVFIDRKGYIRYFGNELPDDYAARLEKISAS